MRIADKSSQDTGQMPLDTKTFESSAHTISQESTCSAGDSPAKTSRSLARELALQVSAAVCGSSMRELLASYDHDSSSWRTSQRSLLAGSPECLVTLPRSGTIRSGSLCALPTLGHHTDANASSSWLTPRAIYGEHSGMKCTKHLTGQAIAESARPTPTRCGNHNRKGVSKTSGDGLATAVNWPTPTSRDWKDGDCRNANVESNGLLGRVALEHQPKGSLNPDWVEALMGFPPGWTDGLPDEAKPSTRGNRRASRRKRTKDGSG